MLYVYHVRRLVKVVIDEIHESTDPLGDDGRGPRLQYCLLKFQWLNKKKYTPALARRTLAIATGKKHYLSIDNSNGRGSEQRLKVDSDGLILLTPTGFINALAESVGKIPTVISLFLSAVALYVSIIALHKH